jgi:23S rRNA (adenine2503-C2)-methyltransferase
MKIIASTGKEEIAIVYILEMEGGKLVECVESVQPPIPREEKWVLLVSTMFGCPVHCQMCDAGGFYEGKLSVEEILSQIDFLVQKRYPRGEIPAKQFKIQFARMGEPALNDAVLEVLSELPLRYSAPGLMPSLSTIAPAGREYYFDKLLEIKNKHYTDGNFQFQFSIHTTDTELRDRIIPVKKWTFEQISRFGNRFYADGDRKITLNFALAHGMPLDPETLLRYFDPEIFLIKITPLNPTYRAAETSLKSYIDPWQSREDYEIVDELRAAGYRVIVSIGEKEENLIGSNCGQYIRRHMQARQEIEDGYTYTVRTFS